jgi:hypothetical protein
LMNYLNTKGFVKLFSSPGNIFSWAGKSFHTGMCFGVKSLPHPLFWMQQVSGLNH